MVSLHYKGRIHKSKFTLRSLRYILSDQAARLFPGLQQRWLFPIESRPVWEAACGDCPLPSAVVDDALPELYARLGIAASFPLQLTDHIYTVDDVVVTGWAGAMMKDGLLLTVREKHNWVAALRAHPHDVFALQDERPYFNLMATTPAKGHIFHWLFNAMVPLFSYLESGAGRDIGLIVNDDASEIQKDSIAYLKSRYGLNTIVSVGQYQAVRVPRLLAAIPVPHIPRALQSPSGLSCLGDFGRFIARENHEGGPRRLFVSRNDARLRRVLNERSFMPRLEAMGFRSVCLARLPIAEQVALFTNAEMVVAPHGAGLAHIAWCRPGTKIIEFFPHPDGPRGCVRNATYDYWLLSKLLGLDYSCHLAGPVETRNDGFRIDDVTLFGAIEEARACPSAYPTKV